MEAKISSGKEVHDKVQILTVLECDHRIDQELMFQTFKKM